MGLIADIYKQKRPTGVDCTANGFSGPNHKYEGVCIVNIRAPFEPCHRYYPVLLICDKVSKYCKVVPARKSSTASFVSSKWFEEKGKWVEDDVTMKGDERGCVMFGGNFCYASDSRLSEHIQREIGVRFGGAIPIHDRIETARMQRI